MAQGTQWYIDNSDQAIKLDSWVIKLFDLKYSRQGNWRFSRIQWCSGGYNNKSDWLTRGLEIMIAWSHDIKWIGKD